MKFGLLPTEKVVPFLLAMRRGLFDESGLDVEVAIVPSAYERDAGFLNGGHDVVLMNLVSVLPLIAKGVEVRALTVVERASSVHAMFKLLATPQPTDGAPTVPSVGTSIGTIAEYAATLLSANVFAAGFQLIDIGDIAARGRALMAGDVYAAALPEPVAGSCERAGCRVLADDRTLTMPPPLFVATEAALDRKRPEFERFKSIYGRAALECNARPDDALAIAMSEGLPFGTVTDLPEFPAWDAPTITEIDVTLEWWKSVKGADWAAVLDPHEIHRLLRDPFGTSG